VADETARVSSLVTQTAHGFERLDPVHFDGTNWVASVPGDAGIGLVGSIKTRDVFEFVQAGYIDGLDEFDLTPGAVYYVQADSTLDTTATASPIFKAYTDISGYVIAPGGDGGVTNITNIMAAAEEAFQPIGPYLRLDGILDLDNGTFVIDVDVTPYEQVFDA